VDRYGHGQSPNTGRFGFEEQADDLADLLGESAHLVGSSYGAVLALIVAQLHGAWPEVTRPSKNKPGDSR
jgi:pimeloyl-ACP methyl ester carboxylesterase